MKQLSMNKSRGTMTQTRYGSIVCSRYTGKFHTERLQSKAETGMWYARMMGNPHMIEGEGETPELAIADMLGRTKSRITKMEKGCDSALKAIKEIEKHD